MFEELGRGEWEQREGSEQYGSQGLARIFLTVPLSYLCSLVYIGLVENV